MSLQLQVHWCLEAQRYLLQSVTLILKNFDVSKTEKKIRYTTNNVNCKQSIKKRINSIVIYTFVSKLMVEIKFPERVLKLTSFSKNYYRIKPQYIWSYLKFIDKLLWVYFYKHLVFPELSLQQFFISQLKSNFAGWRNVDRNTEFLSFSSRSSSHIKHRKIHKI